MDAVSGVDEWVFFAQGACGFEISWIAGHVDECFWLCNLGGGSFFFGRTQAIGKARVLETGEERVERFACMVLVRINMAMGIDEDGGGEWLVVGG